MRDGQPGGGFTTGEPWLPLADDYREHNVNQQSEDPRSTLTLYRRLIGLRRTTPALLAGGYRTLHNDERSFVFARLAADNSLLVALNFTGAPITVPLPGAATLVLPTHLDREGEHMAGLCELRGDEGVILKDEG